MAIVREEDELTLNARVCLRRTRLRRFTASPPSLDPDHLTTTLSWDVDASAACRGLSVTLDSVRVESRGSKTQEQVAAKTYVLRARMRSMEKVLGTVTVPFDLSSCLTVPIGEDLVQGIVQSKVRELVDGIEGVELRSDPTINIESGGMRFSLRALIPVDNAPDIKVDVDGLVELRVVGGSPDVRIRSYSIDVDLPWWVTLATLGASKIAEEFVESVAQDEMKTRMRDALVAAIESEVPRNVTLLSIDTRESELRITACGVSLDRIEVSEALPSEHDAKATQLLDPN